MWEGLRSPDIEWSAAFEEAAWIGSALHPFGSGEVGSVIPDAFESYISIRHPDGRYELPMDDLRRLSETLGVYTPPSSRIWYCVWDGYGWMHGGHAVTGSPPGVAPLDVQAGGRVRLPNREYYLYSGDLSVAVTLMADPWRLQPNLWWPESREWCVATEIDLVVTFVGGSQALVEAISGDSAFGTKMVTADDTFEQGLDYMR